MKKFLQLATLLFAIVLVAALSPASPLSRNASATLMAA